MNDARYIFEKERTKRIEGSVKMCTKEVKGTPVMEVLRNQTCIVLVNRFGFRQHIRYRYVALEEGGYLVVCDDLGFSFTVSDLEDIIETVLAENDRILDAIVAKILDPDAPDLRVGGKRYRMDVVAPYDLRRSSSIASIMSFRDSSK